MRFRPRSAGRVRSIPACVAVLTALLVSGAPVHADTSHGAYKFEPGGRILAVRAAEITGDGRIDLVVLVQGKERGDNALVILRSPESPVPGTLFDPKKHATRVTPPADAGAVAVGRFANGAALRFFSPRGLTDFDAQGKPLGTVGPPTLLGRSAGEPIVFWDGVADLGGDGTSECWFPLAEGEGALHVAAPDGRSGHTLSLRSESQASQSFDHALGREASVPKLVPADLDGDGTKELVALRGTRLLAWCPTRAPATDGPLQPIFEMTLPFLKPDPTLPPEALRSPRIQLADVDGDRKADLLVTFLTGRRDKLGDLKTILFHYAGPFRGKDGLLTPPSSRLDTPSVVLHPVFVDVDGDGDREYVADSIRTKNRFDLLARIMGKDPPVTLEGFRFDQKKGRFESAPAFRVDRSYPSSEAMSNTFGQTAWFTGDFDGDGHRDLLDLGNLSSVSVLRGAAAKDRSTSGPIVFDSPLAGPYPMKTRVKAAAVVADLNADRRDDCVFWTRTALLFLVSRSVN